MLLVHCNIANNDCQQDSGDLYMFVSNKPFGSLLEISPENHIFLKIFNSEFRIQNHNSQPLETEDRINLTLPIK